MSAALVEHTPHFLLRHSIYSGSGCDRAKFQVKRVSSSRDTIADRAQVAQHEFVRARSHWRTIWSLVRTGGCVQMVNTCDAAGGFVCHVFRSSVGRVEAERLERGHSRRCGFRAALRGHSPAGAKRARDALA